MKGLLGRYCQVRYLIWQAERAEDKDTRQAIQHKARGALRRLGITTRRLVCHSFGFSRTWQSKNLPRVTSKEMRYGRKKRASLVSIFRLLNLGSVVPPLCVGRSQLLFKNGQGDSALELLSSIPMESQLAGEGRQAARFARRKSRLPARRADRPEGSCRPNPMISKSESG